MAEARQDRPRVSVVVNNYDYAWCLADAVDSALAQTHPDVEVVVVDDGSTDGSVALLRGYGDAIVLVLKENGGQASALNAGFAASSGEFVVFLDADDTLAPHAVERAVAAWAPGVAKVQWRLDVVDGQRRRLGYSHPPASQPAVQGDVLADLLRRGRYVTSMTSGNLFPRAVLQAVLPIPESGYRIAADGYLVSVVPFHGDVVTLDETLGQYRRHGSNSWSMQTLDVDRLRSFVRHNEARHRLIRDEARRRGMVVADDLGWSDAQHVRSRLVHRRRAGHEAADPDLAVPRSAVALAARGARLSLTDPDLAPWRRAVLAGWFAVVAVAPQPVVSRLAEWAYVPHKRPGRRG